MAIENLSDEFMSIAKEIEDEYFTGEFGVNSELTRAMKDTEFYDQYLDMVMSFRETIGLIVELYMDTKN